MSEYRYYQTEAAMEILDKKRVLIADDMSLGKCAEALGAIKLVEHVNKTDIKPLIVCPNSVKIHWAGEIRKWHKKGNATKIAYIDTPTYKQDVIRTRDADCGIIGYSTLSCLGNQESKLLSLQDSGFQYGIVDEVQNAKNPESIRGMAVKKLFDSMDYLALLSGTPIPNSILDIYILLSLLDKEQFPLTTENPRAILSSFYNMFRQDPEFVKRTLNDHMIRRTVDDYLNDKIPKAHINNLEIRLTGDHKEAYLQIYENDSINPGTKLIQLRKAALDPNLINPKFLNELSSKTGCMQSDIYRSLDNLIERVVDENGKLLVFSDFRKGVTEKLRRRYERYGALIIDGDVSPLNSNKELSIREGVRRKFQNESKHKVLIATTVMDEGVDLTVATDVAHITLPYYPAAFDQRNRRVQRIGEVMKESMNIHIMKPFIENTSLITEGIERLIEDKRRIITYIIDKPAYLTKKDLNEIKNRSAEKSKLLSPFIKSPMQSIMSHLGQLKSKGHKKILAHYKKYPEEAEYIAKLYSSHWNGYYGGNTANLYAKIISTLEEKEDLEKKLDLASGPFCLSRKLNKPVVNLDINSSMLKAGNMLESEGKIVQGNKAIQGSFHQLPFKDNFFDLVLCSLAMHMSTPKKRKKEKISERELVLREMNGVLRKKGYGIITLPHTLIDERDSLRFHNGLESLGFEVLPFSGFYRGPKESNFKVYLIGLRKVSEPSNNPLKDSALTWKVDKKLEGSRRSSQHKKKYIILEPREVKQEFVTEFFNTKTKKSLESSIKESIN